MLFNAALCLAEPGFVTFCACLAGFRLATEAQGLLRELSAFAKVFKKVVLTGAPGTLQRKMINH